VIQGSGMSRLQISYLELNLSGTILCILFVLLRHRKILKLLRICQGGQRKWLTGFAASSPFLLEALHLTEPMTTVAFVILQTTLTPGSRQSKYNGE